jgi:hypothetical protein
VKQGLAVGFVCAASAYILCNILGRFLELTAGPSWFSHSIYMGWGLVQWIALVPLILRQKDPQIARGLRIAGILSTLLSLILVALLIWGLSVALNNIP